MSSSAKFVPTLGGRVWRLQSQGTQSVLSAMKSASSSSNSMPPTQRSSIASFSTKNGWSQSQQSGSQASRWSQRQ